MLYDSDISDLLSQWQETANRPFFPPSYKDAVRDCIYDLKCLVDKSFEEEALANEAFEQQLKKDEESWKMYLNSSMA